MHFARIVSGFIYLNSMYYSAECWRSPNTSSAYRKIVHTVPWFMGSVPRAVVASTCEATRTMI